eukprot:3828563-Prymnesium_polylepis.1
MQCRYHAPKALGANIHRILSTASSASKPRSPTPAACRTPMTCCPDNINVMSQESALSHDLTSTRDPSARSCASRPWPSRTIFALRDARCTSGEPCWMSIAAARRPSPPRPPVTMKVPWDNIRCFSEQRAVQGRTRATRGSPPLHSDSPSANPPSSPALSTCICPRPRNKSMLWVQSDVCSTRITRARPQAPPCAALSAKAPDVKISTAGDLGRRANVCTISSNICIPCNEGADDVAPSRSTATACHGDNGTFGRCERVKG